MAAAVAAAVATAEAEADASDDSDEAAAEAEAKADAVGGEGEGLAGTEGEASDGRVMSDDVEGVGESWGEIVLGGETGVGVTGLPSVVEEGLPLPLPLGVARAPALSVDGAAAALTVPVDAGAALEDPGVWGRSLREEGYSPLALALALALASPPAVADAAAGSADSVGFPLVGPVVVQEVWIVTVWFCWAAEGPPVGWAVEVAGDTLVD